MQDSSSATASFLKRKWPNGLGQGYTQLGRTGLFCSKVGFGGYRISTEFGEHRAALTRALELGVNLIDTSSNYTNGHSELLIGEVLKESGINRQEIIIVTKAGYIQGHAYQHALKREENDTPYGEVVKYDDGLWHCIHPEFIGDQLERSLQRLQTPYIDVFLLHNPEYYLMSLKETALDEDIEKIQFTFYDRIRRAFVALENEVQKGRIKHYGVSSNTLPLPTSEFTAVHLPTLVDIAAQVAEDMYDDANAHHFSVIQCPFNLCETGAVSVKNSDDMSLLEFARSKNIGLLTNRPLNAMNKGKLLRLTTHEVKELPSENLEAMLKNINDLELRFSEDFPFVRERLKQERVFKIGAHLKLEELSQIGATEWQDFAGSNLLPNLLQLIRFIDHSFRDQVHFANDWSLWKSSYIETLQKFIQAVLSHAKHRENQRNIQFSQTLDQHGFSQLKELTLTEKAILSEAVLPEVSSVLVGMRTVDYVDQSVQAILHSEKVDVTKLRQWLNSGASFAT